MRVWRRVRVRLPAAEVRLPARGIQLVEVGRADGGGAPAGAEILGARVGVTSVHEDFLPPPPAAGMAAVRLLAGEAPAHPLDDVADARGVDPVGAAGWAGHAFSLERGRVAPPAAIRSPWYHSGRSRPGRR